MSFLSKIFAKKPAYVHPVFGTMTFVNAGAGRSYWEGHADFAPANATIEVFVDGDESGVASRAEDFYAEIQTRYSSIVALFRPEMDRRMIELSKERVPESFEDAYRLSSVSVVDTTIRKDWTLGFDCLFDDGFSISIELSDWEHGVVVVDS